MCYHGSMEQKKDFLSAEALLAAAQEALCPMQFRGGEGGQVACALQTEIWLSSERCVPLMGLLPERWDEA